MTIILGIILTVFVGIIAGFVGLFIPNKVHVGESKVTAGWGEILGGYNGNLGDEISYGDSYQTYNLIGNTFFIILAVIFILIMVAYLVIEYKNENNYFKNPKVILITRIVFFAIPFVINTIQSITYGHFVIFGLGTLLLFAGGITYGISQNID